jgi:hypothetical protein
MNNSVMKVHCERVLLVEYRVADEHEPDRLPILAAWCSIISCDKLAKGFRDGNLPVCEDHGADQRMTK